MELTPEHEARIKQMDEYEMRIEAKRLGFSDIFEELVEQCLVPRKVDIDRLEKLIIQELSR